MCKTLVVDFVDIINYVWYNGGIINNRKDNMKLKDEIAKIENQSKQIKEAREDIIKLMNDLEV